MTRFKNAELPASTKVQIQDLFSITLPMINRMTVEGKSKAIIKPYARAVERLVIFHDFTNPRDLDLDEVMDFWVDPTQRSKVNWHSKAPIDAKIIIADNNPKYFNWLICQQLITF